MNPVARDAIPVARDAIRVARDGGNLRLSGTVRHTPNMGCKTTKLVVLLRK